MALAALVDWLDWTSVTSPAATSGALDNPLESRKFQLSLLRLTEASELNKTSISEVIQEDTPKKTSTSMILVGNPTSFDTGLGGHRKHNG